MGKKTRHAWGAKTELECRGRSMKRVDEFFVRISKATNSFFRQCCRHLAIRRAIEGGIGVSPFTFRPGGPAWALLGDPKFSSLQQEVGPEGRERKFEG